MNGRDIKMLLPIAVVVVIILGVLGLALMGGQKKKPKESMGPEENVGPYYIIIGPITDLGGNSIEGASVVLSKGNETIGIGVTDTEGYVNITTVSIMEDGEYKVSITAEGYEPLIINVTLKFDGNSGTIVNMVGGMKLEKKVKVLQINIGPVKGKLFTPLEGVSVVLLRNNLTVAEATTDAEGMATLVLTTPIETGAYTLSISTSGYETKEINVNINYNEKTEVLSVDGNISNIHLQPIEKVEKVDYYKELEAYKEIESEAKEPVDVRATLDPDKDDVPEIKEDAMQKINQNDIDISPWLGTDENSEPEYSPEISSYVPEDFDGYTDETARDIRSNGNTASNDINLTHMDDFMAGHALLNNKTGEIMNNTSEVTDISQVNNFKIHVLEGLLLINNTMELGYINGTNMTDENGDGKNDHQVIWKAAYIKEDRDQDGNIDFKAAAIHIIEMWDNNSNGIWEKAVIFAGAKRMYDNNSDGTFEDIIRVVILGAGANIDGNLTEHYNKTAIFVNHTIDGDNDNNTEYHSAVAFVKESVDNNSNGYFDYQHSYVAGYMSVDEDDDGVKEETLLVFGREEMDDRNADGQWDHNLSTMWMLHTVDEDEDGYYELAAVLVLLNEKWDNNTNNHYEDINSLILGYIIRDNDSDGTPERMEILMAYAKDIDRNDDGNVDMNITLAYLFAVEDTNGDEIYEEKRGFHFARAMYDNNTNGHFEVKYQRLMGFVVMDKDSNGIENEIHAVYFATADWDRNDDGVYDRNTSIAMVLEAIDKDEDGNPEWKHAVFAMEEKWDNNTDGLWDNRTTFIAGYEGYDNNSNGLFEKEWIILHFNETRDYNGDGNPETIRFFVAARYKHDANEDNLSEYERNVFAGAELRDNNSNGYFEYIEAITAGHEGINASMNGTNITWDEEHVLIYYTVRYDYDDDGTEDARDEHTISF